MARPTGCPLGLSQNTVVSRWLVTPIASVGSGDMRRVSTPNCQVTEAIPLFSHQKPIDNLTRDQRHQHLRFARAILQAHQPHNSIQQIDIHRADIDSTDIALAWQRGMTCLFHH